MSTRFLPIETNKAVELSERGLLSTYESLAKFENELDELRPTHASDLVGEAFGRYTSKPLSESAVAGKLRELMLDDLAIRTSIDMPGVRTTYGYMLNNDSNKEFIEDFALARRKRQQQENSKARPKTVKASISNEDIKQILKRVERVEAALVSNGFELED